MLRKYTEYFNIDSAHLSSPVNADANAFQIFNKFVFKKQISTKIVMKNTEQVVIGTVWEEILDVGLGERNSMGFGFMNLKKV